MELVEVEFKYEHGEWVLRVFIDCEGGVRLQDCERVSREIGPVLDVEDPVVHPFTLEVSSPGVNRLLKKPADFKRFRGKMVRIKLFTPLDGEKTFTACIKKIEADEVILDKNGKIIRLPFTKIAKANLEIEW